MASSTSKPALIFHPSGLWNKKLGGDTFLALSTTTLLRYSFSSINILKHLTHIFSSSSKVQFSSPICELPFNASLQTNFVKTQLELNKENKELVLLGALTPCKSLQCQYEMRKSTSCFNSWRKYGGGIVNRMTLS